MITINETDLKNIKKLTTELDEKVDNAERNAIIRRLASILSIEEYQELRENMDPKTFAIIKVNEMRWQKVRTAIDAYNYYTFNIKYSGAMFLTIAALLGLTTFYSENIIHNIALLINYNLATKYIGIYLILGGIYNIFNGLRIPYEIGTAYKNLTDYDRNITPLTNE